jgi:hypothetical protein
MVGGQHHNLSALPQEKTGNPLHRRLGGPQDQPGRVRKILPPHQGFDPRTVQTIVSPACPYSINKICKFLFLFCVQ